jgi:hypothetical protein
MSKSKSVVAYRRNYGSESEPRWRDMIEIALHQTVNRTYLNALRRGRVLRRLQNAA